MDTIYICPDCGHEFQQGEYGYDYDYNVLEFECPHCGWYGTDSTVETDDDEDDDE
jgi:DNA-directed RNA polymerase subunit RPC12/RpoP